LSLGTCLQGALQAWGALAGCPFPSSAIQLNANTTREGVWTAAEKSGLLTNGKVSVLEPSLGAGSDAGGSFWWKSPCLGLAFLLSTLQCHGCVVMT